MRVAVWIHLSARTMPLSALGRCSVLLMIDRAYSNRRMGRPAPCSVPFSYGCRDDLHVTVLLELSSPGGVGHAVDLSAHLRA